MEKSEEPESQNSPPTTDNNDNSTQIATSTNNEDDNRQDNESEEDVNSNVDTDITTNTTTTTLTKKPICSSCNLEKSPSSSTLESDLNTALNDLKVSHLKEMTELRVSTCYYYYNYYHI